QANTGARRAIVAHYVMAVGQYLPAAGVYYAADNTDKRRYPRPIGAEQCENFAAFDIESYIFKCCQSGWVGICEVLYRNNRLLHGLLLGRLMIRVTPQWISDQKAALLKTARKNYAGCSSRTGLISMLPSLAGGILLAN